MDRQLLFYDFEVFAKDWLVVVINKETKEKEVIVNDKFKLKAFYNLHKDDIWIGYNSRGYDQFILKGILLGKDPYVISNKIIVEGKNGYNILKNTNSIQLNNFDISTGFHGLKQLEAFMGSRIKESSVSFTLQRKLTEDELKETIEYCTHDVEQTIEVFIRRKDEFYSQLSLIEAFDLDMGMFNKTKAQLSAHILGTVRQDVIDDEFNIIYPHTLKLSKYKYVIDWYKNPRNWTYSRKLVTHIAGVEHTFAFGGLHGAVPNYSGEGIILCADVGSMYPAIMIEYNLLSRNVLNHNKYREIRDTRLELKRKKDKKQAPYKIVLNGTFGASKDIHNPLFDPLMANSVCIVGQLLILDLIEKIESYGELIQSNTDGIFIKVKDMETVEKIKEIAKEWEIRTKLDLEWDIFSKCIQKDVNNYIIFHEDGSYKSKGAYIKELSEIDYDLAIVNTALVNYFKNNISMEETVNNCDDLIEFQKVVKITSLYKYALYGETQLSEKVLRVFASNQENAKGVFKVKSENKIEKIANTPEKCFIDNENIVGKKVPEYIDKQYYIDLAYKRLNDFIEVGKEKKLSADIQLINVLDKNLPSFYDVLIDIKQNTSVGFLNLVKYLKIDAFKKYGKAKKLLDYLEYFKLLYNKKNLKKDTLLKNMINEDMLEIIKQYSEFNESKGTFSKFDSESCLRSILNYIPNSDIDIIEKLRQEYDLYEDLTLTDNTRDVNDLYIMAVNQTVNPSIIAYCISKGVTQFLKVHKELFKILEIRQGDVVKATEYENKFCKKISGKDSTGVNILEDDTTKKEWWLMKYDILDRDYEKNSKLIIDEELENV